MTMNEWLRQLLAAGGSGFLVHGGPGSGKTTILRYLAVEINASEGDGWTIGPFDMGQYAGEDHLNIVLNDLAAKILDAARQHPRRPDVPSLPDNAAAILPSRVAQTVSDGLRQTAAAGEKRVILLLDNYDLVHPLVAVRLASYLRTWYEEHKDYFTFILTSESDLEELRTTESVYSPLRNVVESYLLLDFTRPQVQQFAQQLLPALDEDEQLALWDVTLGYPALVKRLLETLQELRESRPGTTITEAVATCLNRHARTEPLRTATRRIEALANLNARDFNPAQELDNMRRGIAPQLEENRAARLLLAMGIFGWRGRHLTWRNPFVQNFFEASEAGRRMLQNWLHRPVSFRDSELSAQGTVLVSLFLDLAPWLENPGRDQFDNQRGTEKWTTQLRHLPLPDGAFTPWKKQAELVNIGHDLNLFREQAHRSFMPIYEAPADAENLGINWDQQLQRLGLGKDLQAKAKETLIQEWRHWDKVRLQFTRDGAVHLTLVRQIDSPLPLMQILDELLGLERELNSRGRDNHVDLSVQWELALAVLDAFFHQLGGEQYPDIPSLGLRWQKPDTAPSSAGTSQGLYPQRDRYAIFMLRKLCNCRKGGLRLQLEERQLITVEDDLEPLFRDDAPIGQLTEYAYRYGRELTCLLEGVMIREPAPPGREQNRDNEETIVSETGRFPNLKPREIRNIFRGDLASWQNELFLASLDNAIVIYQAIEKLKPAGTNNSDNQSQEDTGKNNQDGQRQESADSVCLVCRDWEQAVIQDLYFPQRTVPYEDYWQCVALGLQYVIELRWATQWVARRTTTDLVALASLMEKQVEERSSQAIDRLSQNLALTTRLLSHLRDASIPMFIASTDYAARKYEHMITASSLRETIVNAEKNIEALNTFLNHHAEQRMQLHAQEAQEQAHQETVALQAMNQTAQENAERQNKRLNMLGVGIAILSIFLAVDAILVTVPSMWIDFGGEAFSLFKFWEALLASGPSIVFGRFGVLIYCTLVVLLLPISVMLLALFVWLARFISPVATTPLPAAESAQTPAGTE
ncbi:MAG: hypothetical protein H6988_09835 [Pseudomonadales bacterium]|nr:hypothetical protein [Pseudomonadales bacterium]